MINNKYGRGGGRENDCCCVCVYKKEWLRVFWYWYSSYLTTKECNTLCICVMKIAWNHFCGNFFFDETWWSVQHFIKILSELWTFHAFTSNKAKNCRLSIAANVSRCTHTKHMRATTNAAITFNHDWETKTGTWAGTETEMRDRTAGEEILMIIVNKIARDARFSFNRYCLNCQIN